ncbi:demethylmenaquinone methyltransferase [Shimazuella kribbensis]|uniref:demethylmenaquinone methyltransferase n=1 Tax=Shimazuella kribbensis TaxID=139808 RepID=UPI0003F5A339|nr:demethylmenaquinone methyltransferase [Shimazuella kribbensis]
MNNQKAETLQGTEKEKFVQQVFEDIAENYDQMNSILSFRRHQAWRKFAMKKMQVGQGDSAIDVCCGTCDWTISLAKASKTGSVIGLDFSPKMLTVGMTKLQKEKLEDNVNLIEGNAMELPYPDNTFDFATIGFALRNVPDVTKVLQEMKRVVKPGGKVVSLELSKPTWKPFRSLYFFYFGRILPLLGKLFVNRYEQYKWLPTSLQSFPDYKELEQMMKEEVGFSRVEVYPLSGGITALHIGYK